MSQLLSVGIIADGNRTWAERNSFSQDLGYQKGASRAFEVANHSLDRRDIENITFFVLSKDNIRNRTPEQVSAVVQGIQTGFDMIRMKDPVLREFSQLFERRNKFGYGMTLYRSFKDAIKKLKEMEKKGETLPMFLEFYRIES